MITYKQLSLADIFTNCKNKFDNDKYAFLSILDETINLDEIVPVSFTSHFHAATGRPRKHLSGIEAWVTENNPKYANRIIKQLKAFKKVNGLDDSYDPYKAAYGSMPSHVAANPAIQQIYINGRLQIRHCHKLTWHCQEYCLL